MPRSYQSPRTGSHIPGRDTGATSYSETQLGEGGLRRVRDAEGTEGGSNNYYFEANPVYVRGRRFDGAIVPIEFYGFGWEWLDGIFTFTGDDASQFTGPTSLGQFYIDQVLWGIGELPREYSPRIVNLLNGDRVYTWFDAEGRLNQVEVPGRFKELLDHAASRGQPVDFIGLIENGKTINPLFELQQFIDMVRTGGPADVKNLPVFQEYIRAGGSATEVDQFGNWFMVFSHVHQD